MSKQLTLDLDTFLGPAKPATYVELFCGLTPWKLTREERPPFLGWWRTWSARGRAERRWWNGYTWSVPAVLGADDAVTADARDTCTLQDSMGILWCGLCRPHLAGYLEYALVRSPRLQIHHMLTQGENRAHAR